MNIDYPQVLCDNYIVLINRFWRSFAEGISNTNDIALYFFLLNTCNILGWKQPFTQSDRHLAAMLGLSVPTVRKARQRLKKRKLLNFAIPQKPSKAEGGQTRYWFNKFEKIKLPPAGEGELPRLKLPFLSPGFIKHWEQLLEQPKWKKRGIIPLQAALDELQPFGEEYATLLISQAIEGKWQRIVFPETEQKYRQWKNNKQNGKRFKADINSDAERRKSEIVRRAAAAASACSR